MKFERCVFICLCEKKMNKKLKQWNSKDSERTNWFWFLHVDSLWCEFLPLRPTSGLRLNSSNAPASSISLEYIPSVVGGLPGVDMWAAEEENWAKKEKSAGLQRRVRVDDKREEIPEVMPPPSTGSASYKLSPDPALESSPADYATLTSAPDVKIKSLINVTYSKEADEN